MGKRERSGRNKFSDNGQGTKREVSRFSSFRNFLFTNHNYLVDVIRMTLNIFFVLIGLCKQKLIMISTFFASLQFHQPYQPLTKFRIMSSSVIAVCIKAKKNINDFREDWTLVWKKKLAWRKERRKHLCCVADQRTPTSPTC